MRTTLINVLAMTLALAMFAACGEDAAVEPVADTATVDAPESAVSVYEAAVNNPLRPTADRNRDAGRKPAGVLEFMAIEPGMTVLDMYSGSGWYAEVIAHVVGSDGKVIAHSNEAYKNFVGDALEERFAAGRVAQVEILMAANNHLSLEEDSLDAVMLAQAFHDMYHEDIGNDWELLDRVAFLAELRKGLKPDGIVAIIDHTALAGSPPETGDTLHRIDPELVIANMEAAGFIFEASSDLLKNPDDDLTQAVFAKDIRGKTDRFIIRFRNTKQ